MSAVTVFANPGKLGFAWGVKVTDHIGTWTVSGHATREEAVAAAAQLRADLEALASGRSEQ